MTEEIKGKNKKKKGSTLVRALILVIMLVVFVVVGLGVIYFADYFRIQKEFGGNIWINGERMGGKSPEETVDILENDFKSQRMYLTEEGTDLWDVTLGEIGYSLEKKELLKELEEIRSKQKCKFPFLKDKEEYHLDIEPVLNEEEFNKMIAAENFKEGRVEPVNAYVQYNAENKVFEIVPEVKGTVIDDAGLQTYIKAELEKIFAKQEYHPEFQIKLDDSCYVAPEVTSTDETLNAELNSLNGEIDRYKNTTVTHVFGDTKEVITGEMICSWLVVENNQVTLAEEPVRQYITDLASKYNTMYRDRYFTTTDGTEVLLEHNEYGYLIKTEEEFQQLYKDLGSGEQIEREPIYTERGYQRNGKDDIMGSYIEVSLEKQHLWLYKDGALVTETDIVSGLPTEERETYRGAWPIFLKASPFELSSEEYGYNVEVQYWMPFVYGQGLHDAGWRSAFGGEIYKTDGSHGCINLPPDQAKIIFDTVDKNYPIILY